MSAKNPEPVEGIDVPTDAMKMGVDLRGYTHYWSAYCSTVYVYDGKKKVREKGYDALDAGVVIAQWVTDVEEQVGWLELDDPNKDRGDWFMGALEDVV